MDLLLQNSILHFRNTETRLDGLKNNPSGRNNAMPYNLNLPEAFNAADHFVDRNVREGRGGKVAVRCEDRSFTYLQIQEKVNRTGNALKSLDIRMEELFSNHPPATEI